MTAVTDGARGQGQGADAQRVIVTGASGFIGAAAVRRLVGVGARVLACVRPGTDRWRLAALPRDAVEVAEVDLAALSGRALEDLRAAFRGFGPAAVLHAGWVGIRGAARNDPAQTANVTAAVEVVRAAAEAGARRFVGIGSQAEYGPSACASREDDCPRPATMYGAAKLAAGQLCLAVAERVGMSAAWARAFSVYGPGELRGALVPDLVRALAAGTPFPLSTCDQLWDYLYEDDAAEALALLLVREDARGVFNLASGVARPLKEAVLAIRAHVAPDAALRLGELPGKPASLVADVSRLRAATGWGPRVALEEGIRRTAGALLGGRA
jgi:nucleoside-diphosphate-sugar epimerase